MVSIAVNPDKKCVRGSCRLCARSTERCSPRSPPRLTSSRAAVCLSAQLFSIEEREALIKRMCEVELGTDASRVRVVSFDGLVVEFAKENGVHFLVRGLRAFSGAW